MTAAAVFWFCFALLLEAMHPARGMIGLHWEIYPFFLGTLRSAPPILTGFLSHLAALGVSPNVYAAQAWGAKWPKRRGEIQHEGKAVENVSKATERVRKRERIKRIVSGRKKQRAPQHISRKRQESRRRNSRNAPGLSLFFPSFFLQGGSRRRACYISISSSKYGTVPTLQDDCRSVQPQPLLHLFSHINTNTLSLFLCCRDLAGHGFCRWLCAQLHSSRCSAHRYLAIFSVFL